MPGSPACTCSTGCASWGSRRSRLESGDDVGGTWYWNRYPGARCDIPTTDYTYSFDPELETEWTWSEKYATQPEILRYLQHVADKHDLRRDIRFSTTVDVGGVGRRRAALDGHAPTTATRSPCRYYVMATGCLSMPKELDIEGADRFAGEVYFTSRWPHEGVDFTGKRVGVIGTGSSGIQSIPLIAEQAAELVVFQRTPNFSIPAHNGPASAERLAADRRGPRRVPRGGALVAGRRARRHPEPRPSRMLSRGGAPRALRGSVGRGRAARRSAAVRRPGHQPRRPTTSSPSSSASKIRSIVNDPETAEALCPTDHPFGTKRPCLDTGYYETFNLPHVRLVDLRKHPITTDHRDGHRHDRRVVRVRRHRLRHRLRRDDRRPRRASTSPAATA